MPAVIASNLPTIMQAVEQRLLTFLSTLTTDEVVGSVTNIYWVLEGEEPKPGVTGQRDILLIERTDDTENSVVGAGRFARIASGIDVNLRSSYASDRHGTKRDFIIAHRAMVDALMDALMGFFPVDGSENALTIEGFVLDTNARPDKERRSLTWGQTIGTYRFHYMPKVDTTILA